MTLVPGSEPAVLFLTVAEYPLYNNSDKMLLLWCKRRVIQKWTIDNEH
jgi:hypothetical protein